VFVVANEIALKLANDNIKSAEDAGAWKGRWIQIHRFRV